MKLKQIAGKRNIQSLETYKCQLKYLIIKMLNIIEFRLWRKYKIFLQNFGERKTKSFYSVRDYDYTTTNK